MPQNQLGNLHTNHRTFALHAKEIRRLFVYWVADLYAMTRRLQYKQCWINDRRRYATELQQCSIERSYNGHHHQHRCFLHHPMMHAHTNHTRQQPLALGRCVAHCASVVCLLAWPLGWINAYVLTRWLPRFPQIPALSLIRARAHTAHREMVPLQGRGHRSVPLARIVQRNVRVTSNVLPQQPQ